VIPFVDTTGRKLAPVEIAATPRNSSHAATRQAKLERALAIKKVALAAPRAGGKGAQRCLEMATDYPTKTRLSSGGRPGPQASSTWRRPLLVDGRVRQLAGIRGVLAPRTMPPDMIERRALEGPY